MSKTEKQNLIAALIETSRLEFYTHAFPQTGPAPAQPEMARAFLSASLGRAKSAARLMGHAYDPNAAHEILGTTPEITEGLMTLYNESAPKGFIDTLRKTQKQHLANRAIDTP